MKQWIPLALSLSLAGCVATAPQPGAEPTQSAAQLHASLKLDAWWLVFDDALLNQRIARALERNADLAVAAARLREARAQLAEASGARLPVLSLVGDTSRGRISADQGVGGSGSSQSLHRNGLLASYELDLWGRLAAGDEAASARLAAQDWARSAIAWSLSSQVAELHVAQAALNRQIEIAEAMREGRARTLSLRQHEQRAGAGSEFELRRAEAELAAAESTRAALQRRQVAGGAALALLLGDSRLAEPTPPLLAEQGARDLRLPAGELSEMLSRRPDVQQAERLLVASGADLTAARAGRLPSVQLSGRLGSDVRELSNLFNGPGFAWSVASSFAQTLFDGGRTAARVEQADARSDAQRVRHEQALRQAAAEAHEALAALQINQQALEAGQQRSRATGRAQQLAELARRSGAISQLDVLDAERNHFQAQLDEVDALRARVVGEVAVFKALGPVGRPGAPAQREAS